MKEWYPTRTMKMRRTKVPKNGIRSNELFHVPLARILGTGNVEGLCDLELNHVRLGLRDYEPGMGSEQRRVRPGLREGRGMSRCTLKTTG